MVRALTDNRNRTAAEVRHQFDRSGGNMGQTGSVSYLFSSRGRLIIDREEFEDEEAVMMDALDAGADDFTAEEEIYEILTDPADYSAVREALEAKGYSFMEAAVEPVPSTWVQLDEEKVASMEKLIDGLEDLDDVQEVFHNWEA